MGVRFLDSEEQAEATASGSQVRFLDEPQDTSKPEEGSKVRFLDEPPPAEQKQAGPTVRFLDESPPGGIVPIRPNDISAELYKQGTEAQLAGNKPLADAKGAAARSLSQGLRGMAEMASGLTQRAAGAFVPGMPSPTPAGVMGAVAPPIVPPGVSQAVQMAPQVGPGLQRAKQIGGMALDIVAPQIPQVMAAKGLAHGTIGTAESVNIGGQFLSGRVGSKAAQEFFKTGAKFWESLGKKYELPEELQGNILDKPELLGNAAWWAYGVSDMAPSFAAAMIPGVGASKYIQIGGKVLKLSPAIIARLAKVGGAVIGGSAGGSLEGVQTYKTVLERGGEEGEAAAAGTMMTLASAGLNAISVGTLLDKKVKNKILNYLIGGGVEGVTEWMEEPAEGAILSKTSVARPEDKPIKRLREGLNVLPLSFIVGVGGAASTQGNEPTAESGNGLQRLDTPPATQPQFAKEDLPPDGFVGGATAPVELSDRITKGATPLEIENMLAKPELTKKAEEANITSAALLQPKLDEIANEVISDLDGVEYKGSPKSVKSIFGKVVRKQIEKPGYDVYDLKDLARGMLIGQDTETLMTAAQRLKDRGLEMEVFIDKPLNKFGYRGFHGSMDLGNGVRGEVQFHTPESKKIKDISDEIYRKWRGYTDADFTNLRNTDRAKFAEYVRDMRTGRTMWRNYWAKTPEATKALISSSPRGLESVTEPSLMPVVSSDQALATGSKTMALSSSTQNNLPSGSQERSSAFATEGFIPSPPSTPIISQKPGNVKGPETTVLFEVAPDPDNAELTKRWNAMPPKARRFVSEEIVRKMAPKVFDSLGVEGKLETNFGGYLDESNVSYALTLPSNMPNESFVEAAKNVGLTFSQKSVVATRETMFPGAQQFGHINISLPKGSTEEFVNGIYAKLREIETNGMKLVEGQTTLNSKMAILVDPKIDLDALADAIDKKLGGLYTIKKNTIFASFLGKEDYDAGNRQSRETAGQRRPIQRDADILRGEASAQLEAYLSRYEETRSGRATQRQATQVTAAKPERFTARELIKLTEPGEVDAKLDLIFGSEETNAAIDEGAPVTKRYHLANKYRADLEYAIRTRDEAEAQGILDAVYKSLGNLGHLPGTKTTTAPDLKVEEPTPGQTAALDAFNKIIAANKLTDATFAELVYAIEVDPDAFRKGYGTEYQADKFTIRGATYPINTHPSIRALVRFSIGANRSTGWHEALHVSFRNFLDSKERRVLLDKFKTEEKSAEAFVVYMEKRTGQEKPTQIKAIFDKLLTFFKRLRNYINSNGFQTWEDVFRTVAEGRTQARVRTQRAKAEPAAPAFQAEPKDQTQTPEFKRWFGNSVVTDTGKPMSQGGKPLVVYHGTKADFNEFRSKSQYDLPRFWFSSNPEIAGIYGKDSIDMRGAQIKPLYVSMENPKIFESFSEFSQSTRDSELAKQGFDGVIFKIDGKVINGYSWKSTNLKSATGNTGAFDAKNPDIRYQAEENNIRIEETPDGALFAKPIGDVGKNERVRIILRSIGTLSESDIKGDTLDEIRTNAKRFLDDWAGKEKPSPAFRGQIVRVTDKAFIYATREGLSKDDQGRRLRLMAKAKAILETTPYVDEIRESKDLKRFGIVGKFEDGDVIRVVVEATRNEGKILLSVFDIEDLQNKTAPNFGKGARSTLSLPRKSGEVKDGKAMLPNGGDIYARNRALSKSAKGFDQKAREVWDSAADIVQVLLEPISTTLKNAHPSLKVAIRRNLFNYLQTNKADMAAVAPFMKKSDAMSKADQADLDLAGKNGDTGKINEILKRNGATQEYAEYRKTMDSIRQRAVDSGIDMGYLDDYFPRVIEDEAGFLEAVKVDTRWPDMDAIIKQSEKDGEPLTKAEKIALINNYLRGYGHGTINIARVGNTKARSIDVLPPELNRFYKDWRTSVVEYVERMNKMISDRTFFGKHAKDTVSESDALGVKKPVLDVEKSIGAYVNDVMEKGLVSRLDEKALTRALQAYFSPVGPGKAIQFYRDITTMQTIGNVISAITQIQDLDKSLTRAPLQAVPALLRSVFGRSSIKLEDMGLQHIAEEFVSRSKLSKMVSGVLKYAGLTSLDRITAETPVNAIINQYRSRARKGMTLALQERLQEAVGDRWKSVANDLVEGKNTRGVIDLAFNTLLDFQPKAGTELPVAYHRGGNARIFYTLKTFQIRQLDYIRNEIMRDMNKPEAKAKAQAMARLLMMVAVFAALGMGTDALKDWILGRKTALPDRFVDNILKIAGLSKWTIYKARQEGLGSAVMKTILPPAPMIDQLSKDIRTAGDKKGLESVQSIPLVGKAYYWRFGRGREKTLAKHPEMRRGGQRVTKSTVRRTATQKAKTRKSEYR